MSETLPELVAREVALEQQLNSVRRKIAKAKRRHELLRVLTRIAEDVELVTGIRVETILGRSRLGSVTHARWAAWWLLAEIAELSHAGLGDVVGRDHTTIINAFKRLHSTPAWSVVLRVFALNQRSRVLTLPAPIESRGMEKTG